MTIDTLKVIITAETEKLNRSLDTTKKQLKSTQQTASQSTSSMGKAFSAVGKKFALTAIAVKLVTDAIKKLEQAVKEGLQSAYQFSKEYGGEFADSMSRIKSATTFLSHTLAAMFVPIIQSLAPLIEAITTKIGNLANKVAEFFAILTGKSTFLKGKKGFKEYLSDTEKSVEKLAKALAGFDEINDITQQKGVLDDLKDWWENAKVDETSPMGQFAVKLRELGKKVGALFEPIWEGIKTNGLGILEKLPTVLDIIKSLISGINSFLVNTIENVSKLIDLVSPIIDAIGYFVASTFRAVTDWWERSGKPIWEKLIEFINKVQTEVTDIYMELKPFLEYIGAGIEDLVDNTIIPAWNEIMDALDPLIDVLKVLWDFLKPILASIVIGIGEIATVVWSVFKPAFTYFADMIKYVFRIFGGLADIFVGFWTGDFERIWVGVKNTFAGVINFFIQRGADLANINIGLVNGIVKAVETAVNFIIKCLNTISFDIPDWVPFIGGRHFGFDITPVSFGQVSEIKPDLLSYTERDFGPQKDLLSGYVDNYSNSYTGNTNEKNMIQQIDEFLNSSGGGRTMNGTEIEDLADYIKSSTPIEVNLNVDGKQLATTTIRNINNISRQSGNIQLAMI